MIDFKTLKAVDPEICESFELELTRQRQNIELIASENIVSPAVMAAMGSHLTNKYAEGLPGKRYYGGCQCVDIAENLAIERAKKLFGAEHANVQPHSGANANLAAFYAFMKPGDTYMGMSLAHGGHLTHGSPVAVSGTWFKVVPYFVSEKDYRIDYDALEKTALECKPKLIIAGASAYGRVIDFKRFREICDKVGAILMVDIAHIAGLIAAGIHPSPVPYADVVTTTTHKTLRGPRGGLILCKEKHAKAIDKAVFPGTQGGPLMHIIAAKAVCLKEAMQPEFVEYQKQVVKNAKKLAETLMANGVNIITGGTANHLMLVDLTKDDITGKELEALLDKAHVTVNKNGIPFDKESPFVTSGIRIGTPAVTTRGMKEPEMVIIGEIIADLIKNKEAALERSSEKVLKLTQDFPIYENDILR